MADAPAKYMAASVQTAFRANEFVACRRILRIYNIDVAGNQVTVDGVPYMLPEEPVVLYRKVDVCYNAISG